MTMMLFLLSLIEAEPGRAVHASDVYSLMETYLIGAAVVVILFAIGWVYWMLRREAADRAHTKQMEKWIITLNNATQSTVATKDMLKGHDQVEREWIEELRASIQQSCTHRGYMIDQLKAIESKLDGHDERLNELRSELEDALEKAQNGSTE